MIRSEEIAVVVQGPVVERLTASCLLSLRRVLPGAQLILSTWKGADLGGLSFDALVQPDDPGGAYMVCDGGLQFCNINRQLVSTQAGLRLVERPFTLKFRTDLELTHDGFLRHFGGYPARARELRVFEERIVVSDHYTVDPTRELTYPFHVSDMAGVGRTEDVRKWWDVPLASTPVAQLGPRAEAEADVLEMPGLALLPEQYIWLNALQRAHAVPTPAWNSDEAAVIRTSELALANNFVVLRRRQFGLRLPKHPLNLAKWGALYSHADWRRLYARECDGAAPGARDAASLLKDFAYPRAPEKSHAYWRRALRWLLAHLAPLRDRL